jgi:flavin reductase (DIM6/NTAB) family NADH-FMN oxidoreductase RutF
MKKSLGARTIVYPAPVLIMGTYDKEGKANAMTAAWGGICCSRPPCVAVSVRSVRYSYQNVIARQAFTVSIPSEAHLKEADYFGIVSGRKQDKFAATGLTPVRADKVDAPYVEEFPLILECKVRHTLEIGAHIQFVGEIVDCKAEEDVLGEDGLPDIQKVKPVLFAPESGGYYGVGSKLGRAFSIGKKIKG